MIRIAGFDIDSGINYNPDGQYAEIELVIPASANLADEDIMKIRDATLLEEVFIEYGETETYVGSYALFGWRRMQREWDGSMNIAWQTGRMTEIDSLRDELAKAKQENKELTDALLELANIVGGTEIG